MKLTIAKDIVIEGTPDEILEFIILQELNRLTKKIENNDEEKENK